MKWIIALALTITTSTAALSETARDLYNRCAANDPNCNSYLLGAATIMVFLGKAFQDKDLRPTTESYSVFAICPGKSPVNGEVLRHVFMAWMDRHPDRAVDNIGATALDALTEAWPCENSN